MGITKITQEALMELLAEVFQEHGYQGATLSIISNKTELKRASLYHHFPGGKIDMALAVVEYAKSQLIENALGPLLRSDDSPEKRILEAAENMESFYDKGKQNCLMDSLTVGAKSGDREAIDKALAGMFESFIAALSQPAKDAGASDAEARRRGEEVFIRLEGSLVFARGTGDTSLFKRTLHEMPDILLKKI